MSAMIGHAVETGQPVAIGDVERRSGLYVLGIQGMGKTTLLKNLIDQDIGNGHGLFFLDPHGDAIKEVFRRKDDSRLKEVAVLLKVASDKMVGIGFGLRWPSVMRPGVSLGWARRL